MSKLIGNLETVSSDTPDWSRESKAYFEWEPSRSLITSIRDYQRYSVSSNLFNQIILKKVAILRHRFWSIVTAADIPLNCQIEGGLLMPHPNGIVIHPGVKIGPNCLIFQQVTIGTKGQSSPPSNRRACRYRCGCQDTRQSDNWRACFYRSQCGCVT